MPPPLTPRPRLTHTHTHNTNCSLLHGLVLGCFQLRHARWRACVEPQHWWPRLQRPPVHGQGVSAQVFPVALTARFTLFVVHCLWW